MATFTYDTSFLLHHSDSVIRTYHYTTRHIHGIALDEPGLPYSLRVETISTTLKHHIFGALRPIPHEYQPEPRILLVTKGTEKIRLIEELVPAEGFFKNLIVRDLADYGCPPAPRPLFGDAAQPQKPQQPYFPPGLPDVSEHLSLLSFHRTQHRPQTRIGNHRTVTVTLFFICS